MHTAPPRTISSEQTVAKTGLRMKKLTIDPTFLPRICADKRSRSGIF
jgi:hypothetical protein